MILEIFILTLIEIMTIISIYLILGIERVIPRLVTTAINYDPNMWNI